MTEPLRTSPDREDAGLLVSRDRGVRFLFSSCVAGMSLYGSAIAMLADTAIDGTVQTTLPAGTALAPVNLKVYFLRPVSPDGRDLLARGTVIYRAAAWRLAPRKRSTLTARRLLSRQARL